MPQMAPIGWLSLFIFFSLTFMLFSMMNYFNYLPPTIDSLKNNSYNFKSMNWKW